MTTENLYKSDFETHDKETGQIFGRCPKLCELKVSYRRPAQRAKNEMIRPVLNRPELCLDYLRKVWDRDTLELREEIVLICLDSSLSANGWVRLYAGGYGECTLDLKLLMGIVLKSASSGFILAHNHPSGSLTPSAEDRAVTRRVDQAAKLLGVRFVDHVITAKTGHYSFRMSEPELFL